MGGVENIVMNPKDTRPPWYHRMDEQGETPLSRAFKSSYPLLVELLLSQEEEHSRGRGMENDSLEGAAYWGMSDRVASLLAEGADPSNRDFVGQYATDARGM